ncbi:MAG: hypothetical protein L0Z71_08225 [Anaerolineae bacterium]|nr:hypothetical protein [Anaerolineae bacterium]
MKTNFSRQNIVRWPIVIGAVLALSFLAAPYLPPATLTLLSGHNPYANPLMIHAPWGMIPLIPLALLPESVGRVMLVFCGLASYAYVAYKLGAKPIAIVFLLFSPPVLHVLLNGNLDWLAALGFIAPPQIGLFFISIKPQMGIAVAPFWLIQAWREGGWKQTIKTFAPFAIALLLSFLIFGLWPFGTYRTADYWWNASLWPMSIPVGLALFVASIRKQKIEYARAASPCLSPYVLFHSWVGVILAIVSSTPETIAAVIGLWILVAIRYFN